MLKVPAFVVGINCCGTAAGLPDGFGVGSMNLTSTPFVLQVIGPTSTSTSPATLSSVLNDTVFRIAVEVPPVTHVNSNVAFGSGISSLTKFGVTTYLNLCDIVGGSAAQAGDDFATKPVTTRPTIVLMFAAMSLDILVVIWIRDAPGFGLATAETKETYDTNREVRTMIAVNFILIDDYLYTFPEKYVK
jgi:hypothetical protein